MKVIAIAVRPEPTGLPCRHPIETVCSLQVTAAFFLYFVVDGIVTENAFELLAAVVLDGLVLARVLFYVIAKKRKEFPGRIVLLSGITAIQVFVIVSAHTPGADTPGSPAVNWCSCMYCMSHMRVCRDAGVGD